MSTLALAVGFGLVTASLLAIAAVGFTLQFGITNVLNLSYGAVMTVAAFLAFEFTHVGLNIWVSLALAALCTAVLSVLLSRGVFMPFARRGTSLFGMAIVTVSVQLVIEYGLQAFFGSNFMSYQGVHPGRTVHILGMALTHIQLVVMAIAAGAVICVHLLLQYTRLGKAMRATATNPALARNVGVPTARVMDITWFLSGALCGISGVTLVLSVQSFDFTIGQTFLITVVAAAVLGGVGQPYGAVLGAIVVGVAGSVVANFTSSIYDEVTAFAILVLVLLTRPQGILSEIATQKEVVA